MKKTVLATALVVSSLGVGAQEFVPGEIIVKFKSQPKSLGFAKSMESLNSQVSLVKIDQKSDLDSVIRQLNQDPNIEYAEPNFIYHAIGKREYTLNNILGTNDARFDDLWGLKNTGNNEPRSSRGNSSPSGKVGADINATQAWTLTKGDRKIRIAVIDTGVDYNHEDLKDNIWTNTAEANGQPGVDDDGNGYVDDIHGYDFANNDGDPMDGNGHGTHCSGTIAASHDNSIGIAGVMAEAEIVGIKFLTDQGSGSTADAIKAIDYATTIGVDIMSNSWGGGGFSQALKDSIVRAQKAGIVFTAAAGNSATNNNSIPHYPSNYQVDNVISVAAHNYNDGLASFSCYGSKTVHVAAPGRNILSTTPNNGYEVYSGTSMATPHVSGVIGLYLAYHGSTDARIIRGKLMTSSVFGSSYGRKTIGGGRVDAYNFLQGVVTSRPERPDPNAWQATGVDVFETAHPYAANMRTTQTFTVPGAKFVRIVVDKYDLEINYDSLKILDGSGAVVQTLDGAGAGFKTEYVDGDSITVEFNSDSSVQQWGVKISEVEFIN